MTKRRPTNHKKTGRAHRRWLKRFGGCVAVLVAAGVVILAVFGMIKSGGSVDSAQQPQITPVAQEKGTETAPRQGGPAMAFESTAVDFGDVPLNTPVSYSFPFSNKGDATLQIEDVQVKTLEGC